MIKQFFYTLIPLVVCDGIWLSLMSSFYAAQLGDHMKSPISFVPVVLFYLLYSVGIIILVTHPAILNNFSLGKVFLYGALLGLIAYAAYDLTNQATLTHWSSVLSIVDMGWGTLLTGIVSLISVFLMRVL